jgi:uncharacterized protein (TIGR03435 family)
MRSKIIPFVLLSLASHAQTTGLKFEAASIKPATPLGPVGMRADRKGGPGTTDPGLYRCQNCPLSWVVTEAYSVLPFEFFGPDWLQTVRFDFSAKLPEGTTKDAFRAMLQNLLAERFKLAVHREKRPMQVYELTVAKNGPKFHEGVSKDAPQDEGPSGRLQRDGDGFPILPPGTTMAIASGHARLRSDNQTMAWFVEMLSGQLSSPVIDATDLKGKYDFVVSWAFGGSNSSGSPDLLDPPGPALIAAVQAQLGLKLEQKKGRAEVLVVDHIEKVPTEN